MSKFTNIHCATLRWLMTVSDPSGRFTRWRLCLAEFYFTISYKKGAYNHHADALSRPLTGTPKDVNGDDGDIPAFFLDIDDNVNHSSIEKTSRPTAEFM